MKPANWLAANRMLQFFDRLGLDLPQPARA